MISYFELSLCLLLTHASQHVKNVTQCTRPQDAHAHVSPDASWYWVVPDLRKLKVH
jgi:hypothetical protein